MKRTWLRMGSTVAALGMALGFLTQAGANTIIDTTPAWNGSSGISSFGNPNTATYGETITAPTNGDTQLENFTFFINGPSQQSFKGYVYAWNGSEATGPALYTSPTMSLAGGNAYEATTFNTGAWT